MYRYFFKVGAGLRWLNQDEIYEQMLTEYELVRLDYEKKEQQAVHTPQEGWLISSIPTREEVTGERVVQAPKGTTDKEFTELVRAAMEDPDKEKRLLKALENKYAQETPERRH